MTAEVADVDLWHIQVRHARHRGLYDRSENVPGPQSPRQQRTSLPPRPVGVRRVLYTGGRILQGSGLLLIWWVLLLFAGTADMHTLLFWSMAAVVVFYLGWVCTAWAKRGSKPIG